MTIILTEGGTNILKGNTEPESGQDKQQAAFLAPCLPESSFNAKWAARVTSCVHMHARIKLQLSVHLYNWHFPICYVF